MRLRCVFISMVDGSLWPQLSFDDRLSTGEGAFMNLRLCLLPHSAMFDSVRLKLLELIYRVAQAERQLRARKREFWHPVHLVNTRAFCVFVPMRVIVVIVFGFVSRCWEPTIDSCSVRNRRGRWICCWQMNIQTGDLR